MKRFLLPLLAALALPTAVSAETVEFYANRGNQKRENGDRKGAIKDFNKAIDVHFKKPMFKDLYRVSVVYYARGLIRINDTRKKYINEKKWNGKDYVLGCMDIQISSKMGLKEATKTFNEYCNEK